MGRFIFGLVMAAMFLAWSGPATAQMFCKERAEILAHLSTAYKEAPVAMGLVSNGTVIEALVAPDGKTWTIIVSQPNGVSCVMATGESWQAVAFKEPETPS